MIKKKICYIVFVFVCIILNNCTKPISKEDSITHNNLPDKIHQAILEIETDDSIELAIEVLFFIDNEKIVFKDSCILGEIAFLRAVKIYYLNGEESYLDYALNGLKLSEDCNDFKLKAQLNNLIGIFYYKKRDYITAEKYLKKSVFFGEQTLDKSFVIDTYYTLCHLYIAMLKWEELKGVAKKAITDINTSGMKPKRLKFFYIYWAKAQYFTGEYISAHKNLKRALVETKKIDTLEYRNIESYKEEDYKVYRNIYINYSQLYKIEKKFELALRYRERADSLLFFFNKLDTRKKMTFLEIEKSLKDEVILIKNQQIFNQKIIVVGSILFVLMSVCSIYRIYTSSKKLKIALHQKEVLNGQVENNLNQLKITHKELGVKKNKIEYLLKLNEQSIFTKTLKISTYKDAVNNVMSIISELIDTNDKVGVNKLMPINIALRNIISEEEIWEDFKIDFEKNRPNFFKKLLNIHPALSITEQKHCAYIVINLRSKEVATILNLSPRSVETIRYRIKKKLKLKTITLFDYLNKL
ncbi:LuxR C-terminal-related transcriptional regulator [uncultured Polaribacter sp.]|uniref:LuxR C-terminal-related transcriptional regulator n=1 Tax=uncultured Polaribacter sp. TaxID=174711 RepID=UPI0026143046|nr:LuxR C-terminal-related transcriptional regulator [uncultured Polaribacter sp.]